MRLYLGHVAQILLWICRWTMGGTYNTTGQNTRTLSGSRLAYHRWRTWLTQHEVLLQKVPPVPTTVGEHRSRINALVSPASIGHVDETDQTVTITVAISFQWQDRALELDDDLIQEFTRGNSSLLPSTVCLPASMVWMPPVVLVEGVSILNILHEANEVCVSRDGAINILIATLLTFTCKLYMTHYPFDSHQCPITFYDMSEINNIYPMAVDMTLSRNFSVSGEWVLTDITAKVMDPISEGQQSFSSFIMHMRRKTTFYTVTMLVPMVLTSYLNALVFQLPPDVDSKASYLVTLTVSMSVFLSFFSSEMPRGLDDLPWIYKLLLFVYAESFLTLLMSLLVIHKYKQEQLSPGVTPSSHSSRVFSIELTETSAQRKDGVEYDPHSWSDGYLGGVKRKLRRGWKDGVTAKQLDNVFFLLALLVNTVGMACILSNLA